MSKGSLSIAAEAQSPPTATPVEQVQDWLRRFELLLAGTGSVEMLFSDPCHWRDALAFTWDIRTIKGCRAIGTLLGASRESVAACEFRVAHDPSVQRKSRAGRDVVEAFFNFRTRLGR